MRRGAVAGGSRCGPAACNSGTYTKTWFGENQAVCVNPNFPNDHVCPLTQSFYCANGSVASAVQCAGYWEGGLCAVAAGVDCGWFHLCTPVDTSLSCAHIGSPEACRSGIDEDDDGCIDEGCIDGHDECTCTTACKAGPPDCGNRETASCSPYKPGELDICGDGKDNNCNGVPDDGCFLGAGPGAGPGPSPGCTGPECVKCPPGGTAGTDPVLLQSRSAVTEPFTDFSVDTGVVQLELTRTYSSADWSYSGGSPGPFGRGWHHDWEAWLSCTPSTCTVAFGTRRGYLFDPAGTVLSPDGRETWAFYAPRPDDDNQNVLVRKPTGEWVMFAPNVSEWHFATVCDACSSPEVDPYCMDASAGGKARLVSVLDAKRNAVALTHDRPSGVLLTLSDDLGHHLTLTSTSACADGLASSLSYDGMTVATYAYQGTDLENASDGDRRVLRSYAYDVPGNGRLLAVRNESGDAIAAFSYDAQARAIGIIDASSSSAVDYDAPDGIRVTEFFGDDGYATSTRVLDRDGGVVSVSGESTCGPARSYTWANRRLACSSDLLGHVDWREYDSRGRLVHSVNGKSSQGCPTSGAPMFDPGQSREEWRTYGLEWTVAQGVTIALDTTTSISRRSSLNAGRTITETYGYDPAPQPADPAGYACHAGTLPLGSVVCRRIETGYTYDASGATVLERHATYYSYDARGRLAKTLGPIDPDRGARPGEVVPLEERTYWPDDEALPRRGHLREIRRYSSPAQPPLVTSYDYDAFGTYLTTEPDGGTSLTVKDGRGRTIATIGPDTQAVQTRYHDGSSPRLQLLPSGAAIRFGYDALGRINAIEHLSGDPEAEGASAQLAWGEYYIYDPAGNRVHAERRDAAGQVTWEQNRSYDVQHRLLSEANPEVPATARATHYDSTGFLASTTDEEGRAVTFTPDPLNRVSAVVRSGPGPGGTPVSLNASRYAYQPQSNSLAQVTDSIGQATTYVYDDFGRLLRLGSPTLLSGDIRFTYDPRGNLLQRLDTASTRSYAYDGLDRLVSVSATSTGTAPVAYNYAYDAPPHLGRLTSVTDPDRTIAYTYDPAGRLASETIHENGIAMPLETRYLRDADGAVAEVLYPSGLRLRVVRDAATREIVRLENADDGRVYVDQVATEPGGPVKSLVFGNGLQLARTFDRRYQPLILASGPLSIGFSMSPAGDVASITTAGVTSSLTYDFLDRFTGASSPVLSYRYDDNGNRKEGSGASGSVTTYGFIGDRLATTNVPYLYQGCYVDQGDHPLPVLLMSSSATIETCTAAVRARGLKFAGLQNYGYCYGGNELRSAKVADSQCDTDCTANSGQKCGGWMRNSVYAVYGTSSGTHTLFAYDRQSNLSAISPPPPPPPRPTYIGCYSDQWTRALPNVLMMSYATAEKCAAAAYAAGFRYAGLQDYGYCYAGNDLRYTKLSEGACDMPCDANPAQMCGGYLANSIYAALAPPATAACLRHDALGRLARVGYTYAKSVTAGGMACAQDSDLVNETARFRYDASNRRVARWLAATNQWTIIVPDAAGNPLSELVRTSAPANPWVKVRDYVWLDGTPVAQIEYPGPGGGSPGYAYYFHVDQIGMPRALTNGAGQTVWSASWKPYGDVAETTTPDPLSDRVVVTNLRLPGQYDERLLGSLGLQGPYYNWNRWYLPGVGRYLEPDPLLLSPAAPAIIARLGPVPWYSYANDNPLLLIDPFGLLSASVCGWTYISVFGKADILRKIGMSVPDYNSQVFFCTDCSDAKNFDIKYQGKPIGRKADDPLSNVPMDKSPPLPGLLHDLYEDRQECACASDKLKAFSFHTKFATLHPQKTAEIIYGASLDYDCPDCKK